MDVNGKIAIDKIVRFENVEEEIYSVLRQFDIRNVQLPHANKSENRTHYSHYYDKEAIQIIEDMYWEDIETFDYSFD